MAVIERGCIPIDTEGANDDSNEDSNALLSDPGDGRDHSSDDGYMVQ